MVCHPKPCLTLCSYLLSARLPTISFSAMTNLFVFHRFLQQNSNYQSLTNLRGNQPADDAEEADATVHIAGDEVEQSDAPQNVEGFDLNYSPMTEDEVLAGHLVKARLLELLDHPNLKNHLLKSRMLLPVLVSCSNHQGDVRSLKRCAGLPR